MSEAPDVTIEPQSPMVGMSRQPVVIRERKEFIPSWCDWHPDRQPDLNTPVWYGDDNDPTPLVVNGVYVRVGHVLPERRFAIDPRGKLYEHGVLGERMEVKYAETFALQGKKMAGDPKVIPKPAPQEFVSWTVDPIDSHRIARIGFDPNKPADPNAVPIETRDPEKDPVARAAPGFKSKPEGIFKKAEEEKPQKSERQLRMEEIEQLHRAGILTDDERRQALRSVAEGAGWATPSREGEGSDNQAPPGDPVSSAAPSEPMVRARCGKEVRQRGIRMHQMRCKACNEPSSPEAA